LLLFIFCSLITGFLNAQNEHEEDTTGHPNSNILRFALNAIKKSSPDSSKESNVLNDKSELQFMAYEGKTIRHIFVQAYGFERNFEDTLKPIDYYGTRLLNRLHRNTREWVIRNNLFIKEETEIDPYKMADNEKHLRSLDYIQDARILVKRIAETMILLMYML
jgi:hypothetical protein